MTKAYLHNFKFCLWFRQNLSQTMFHSCYPVLLDLLLVSKAITGLEERIEKTGIKDDDIERCCSRLLTCRVETQRVNAKAFICLCRLLGYDSTAILLSSKAGCSHSHLFPQPIPFSSWQRCTAAQYSLSSSFTRTKMFREPQLRSSMFQSFHELCLSCSQKGDIPSTLTSLIQLDCIANLTLG